MARLRDLVQRRKAVRNIRKITRTMELIATARFKKALDRATEADAYTRKIAELASDLSKNAGEIAHPLLVVRPVVKRSLMLVLCSNRGLCGGYNASILRESTQQIKSIIAEGVSLELELSGKRSIAFYRFQGIPYGQTFTHFEDKPAFDQVEELANRYIAEYTSGKIDRLQVAYMKFVSASRQVPVVETLLPLSAVAPDPAKAADPAGSSAAVDYEFIPSAADILEEIVPMAFKVRLFKCFLDAAVSEQIARRVAMKAATENAADLIKLISRQYNRARQANITKEISELIAGSEALK